MRRIFDGMVDPGGNFDRSGNEVGDEQIVAGADLNGIAGFYVQAEIDRVGAPGGELVNSRRSKVRVPGAGVKVAFGVDGDAGELIKVRIGQRGSRVDASRGIDLNGSRAAR